MKSKSKPTEQDSAKQRFGAWLIRNRAALIVVIALMVLLSVLGTISTVNGMSNAVLLLVCAFVVLACGALASAVVHMIEILRAIRMELVTIRALLDTEMLDDIAADLTAVREQMGKGVFGLLGM